MVKFKKVKVSENIRRLASNVKNALTQNFFLQFAFVLIAVVQIVVYSLNIPSKYPSEYSLSMLGVYFAFIPFLFRSDPAWTSFPMMLVFNLFALVLNWFSFHEDITRYSEKEVCIFGNCRFNSRVTGHITHWMDVITIGIFLKGYSMTRFPKTVLIVTLITYGCLGSIGIEEMTKDGSESDLRNGHKCTNIMPPTWRGGINDVLNIVTLATVWQNLLVCNGKTCNGMVSPLYQVVYTVWKPKTSRGKLSGFFTILASIASIYILYVNSSVQHDRNGRLVYLGADSPSAFDAIDANDAIDAIDAIDANNVNDAVDVVDVVDANELEEEDVLTESVDSAT